MNQACREFWEAYIDRKMMPAEAMPLEVFHFSDNLEFADYLASSTISGFKTGTASLYWDIEFGDGELPQVGALSLVTFANGDPACIIETISIEIVPFEKVSEEFCATEDAKNPSLNDWRECHWKEFSEQCDRLGKTAHESMPVVCERFKVSL
ncbi:MAG: ASCH domain-containing protein [Psychromonas sp.]|nr:ASCH domain-containing protein [Alteromonadales bacterium]MCP5078802.1 ASCH domain-containing protein [Psychromonas sp.]